MRYSAARGTTGGSVEWSEGGCGAGIHPRDRPGGLSYIRFRSAPNSYLCPAFAWISTSLPA